MLGQRCRTGATVRPVRALDGPNVVLVAEIVHNLNFGVCVRCKMIYRYGYGHTELAQIANMAFEILTAVTQCVDIFGSQLILGHTALHFESPDRRDQHYGIGR